MPLPLSFINYKEPDQLFRHPSIATFIMTRGHANIQEIRERVRLQVGGILQIFKVEKGGSLKCIPMN